MREEDPHLNEGSRGELLREGSGFGALGFWGGLGRHNFPHPPPPIAPEPRDRSRSPSGLRSDAVDPVAVRLHRRLRPLRSPPLAMNRNEAMGGEPNFMNMDRGSGGFNMGTSIAEGGDNMRDRMVGCSDLGMAQGKQGGGGYSGGEAILSAGPVDGNSPRDTTTPRASMFAWGPMLGAAGGRRAGGISASSRDGSGAPGGVRGALQTNASPGRGQTASNSASGNPRYRGLGMGGRAGLGSGSTPSHGVGAYGLSNGRAAPMVGISMPPEEEPVGSFNAPAGLGAGLGIGPGIAFGSTYFGQQGSQGEGEEPMGWGGRGDDIPGSSNWGGGSHGGHHPLSVLEGLQRPRTNNNNEGGAPPFNGAPMLDPMAIIAGIRRAGPSDIAGPSSSHRPTSPASSLRFCGQDRPFGGHNGIGSSSSDGGASDGGSSSSDENSERPGAHRFGSRMQPPGGPPGGYHPGPGVNDALESGPRPMAEDFEGDDPLRLESLIWGFSQARNRGGSVEGSLARAGSFSLLGSIPSGVRFDSLLLQGGGAGPYGGAGGVPQPSGELNHRGEDVTMSEGPDDGADGAGSSGNGFGNRLVSSAALASSSRGGDIRARRLSSRGSRMNYEVGRGHGMGSGGGAGTASGEGGAGGASRRGGTMASRVRHSYAGNGPSTSGPRASLASSLNGMSGRGGPHFTPLEAALGSSPESSFSPFVGGNNPAPTQGGGDQGLHHFPSPFGSQAGGPSSNRPPPPPPSSRRQAMPSSRSLFVPLPFGSSSLQSAMPPMPPEGGNVFFPPTPPPPPPPHRPPPIPPQPLAPPFPYARPLLTANAAARATEELLLSPLEWMGAPPHGPGGSGAHGGGRRRRIPDALAEVLSALDRVERDEDLTYEQLLRLEATLFFGGGHMGGPMDDLRLDVDNMTYEELLALEERIGDVNTGIPPEQVDVHLKTEEFTQMADATGSGAADAENEDLKCTVCQCEYEDGENVATLSCSHRYHTECIKKWLTIKNLCPICKAPAAS